MKSASRWLGLAILIALGLRLVFVLLPATPLRTKVVDSIADGTEYDRLAANLARHRTFSRDSVPPFRPELNRTPIYPAFLVPAYLLPGSPLLWAVLLQALLSLAIVLIVWQLALESGLNQAGAALAATLTGLSPNLAFIATRLVTETLFSLILLATLLLFNRYRSNARLADLIGAGTATGLLILTRPIASYFPLLLAAGALGLWWRERQRFRWWSSLLPIGCSLIVIAPWALRNHTASGRYVISTIADRSIYLYTAATVIASEQGLTITAARDSMLAQAQRCYGPLDTADEATLWPALARVARAELARRPFGLIKVMVAGFVGNYALPISIGPLLVHAGAAATVAQEPHVMQHALSLLLRGRFRAAFATARESRLAHLPLFGQLTLLLALLFNTGLLVLLVIALLWGRTRGLNWLLVPILYFTVLTGPVGEARFRAPVEPLLCLLAATAFFPLSNEERKRPGRAPGPAS